MVLRMAFSFQPGADSTITINGVAWTYVAGTPSGNQIEIGSTLGATLTNAEAAPNGGALPQVAAATYGTSGGMRLTVTHDTAGLAGSTFTLAASAASNGNVSGPTLKGNGHRHILDSGGDESPSHTIEIGHPKLLTPDLFRHLGRVAESRRWGELVNGSAGHAEYPFLITAKSGLIQRAEELDVENHRTVTAARWTRPGNIGGWALLIVSGDQRH
jgi:hypothetical protein